MPDNDATGATPLHRIGDADAVGRAAGGRGRGRGEGDGYFITPPTPSGDTPGNRKGLK